MLSNSPDIGRDAFDFIENIQRLSTTGGIMQATGAAVDRFGCEYLCFGFLPGPPQNNENLVLATTLPAAWLKLYFEKQFMHADPAIRHCQRVLRPFRWFKDSPYDPEQEPRAVEVVHRARDFGLLDALVIPTAFHASRKGYVWMGGRALDLPERDMAALHLMALYAFDRVLQLHSPLADEKPSLTPREQEVLTWAARGKPAWEIGEILKISKRTANAHIENARRKLDAVNRTQAVVIALRDRIIQL